MVSNKKKLTKEEEKALLLLKSTYEMHCKTKEEAILRGKTANIDKIDGIINDTVSQMAKIDKEFAEKCVKEHKNNSKKFDLMDAINADNDNYTIFDKINEESEPSYELTDEQKKDTEDFYSQFTDEVDLYEMADNIDEKSSEDESEMDVNFKTNANEVVNNVISSENIDSNAQFDIIPLPSKGECYPSKIDRLSVAYLTASDENLITSPNLYESGNITSILLKKKILDKNINVDNLVSGDVDAIMVFLRGTSYGNDFPIVATDPKTKKKVETNVDLSKLKYKPFNLKGDENGLFTFKLPRLGKNLKFKFLTKKDEKVLEKLNKKESEGIIYFDINDAIDKIKTSLKEDTKLNDTERSKIIDATEKLNNWAISLKDTKQKTPYTKTVTNTMEMQIVSVDGNTDRKYIHDFVMNMPASDSLAFRRYIYENQPGVDFDVEVERPVSDGGGTFKCFLEWDDFVFWHIA